MSELREFLMLAQTADLTKHSVGGWYMSEKLDGMRAFWDGGVTRGMPCSSIMFANVEKHDRFIQAQYSTGLWTRYGQPIHAPNWWLDRLPAMLLDGELYAGRGMFQFVTSTTKDHHPNDEDWKRIEYRIFDTPPVRMVFQTGKINNTNFKKVFNNVHDWFEALPRFKDVKTVNYYTPFESSLFLLRKHISGTDAPVSVHNQIQLPLAQDKAVAEINYWLAQISSSNGEGLMLRKRESFWEPKRSSNLLKVKKLQDAEGTVIGYITGEKTDKGSKLLGMLGSLIVEWKGKVFNLSGFTDEERHLSHAEGNVENEAKKWATNYPATELPEHMWATHFPRGTKVTFVYRELTDAGYPKEARFYRIRKDVP